MKRALWAALVVAVVGAGAPAVVERPGEVLAMPVGAEAVPDSYLVSLRDGLPAGATEPTARKLVRRYGGTLGNVYTTMVRGFAVTVNRAGARRLAGDPNVRRVEPNTVGHLTSAGWRGNPQSWGLDRIDERVHRFDNQYRYPNAAPWVHVFVLDSGIRISHQDFGGRAGYGRSVVDNTTPFDCHNHGTHVAGTIGGTTYGVAPLVKLIAVRVVKCDASEQVTSDAVIAGIDYVNRDVAAGRFEEGVYPAVGNMSFRISGGMPAMAREKLQESIDFGVTWVVSAGNTNEAGCSSTGVPDAITVGATDRNDARWDDGAGNGSNFGPCIDLFAPGKDIMSLSSYSDTAVKPDTGTSMAAPHVAGVAAQILQDHPRWTPQQVRDAIVGDATPGVVTNAGAGSPNLLLHGWPGPIIKPDACESEFAHIRCTSESSGSAIAEQTWYVDLRLQRTTNFMLTFGCSPGRYYRITLFVIDSNGYGDAWGDRVLCTDHHF
jgi:subtilisin family serine protease